jgi:hypothetical protein
MNIETERKGCIYDCEKMKYVQIVTPDPRK